MGQDFASHYSYLRSVAQENIEGYLASLDVSNSLLLEAIRYSVSSTGKLFRPVLCLAVGESFGLDLLRLKNQSVALELFHVASLLHDDLPCIDDDDFRRGKPSFHKVYGDGMAVLVGDFLFSQAFLLVTEATEFAQAKLISKLSAIALSSLNEGQVLDLALRAEVGEDEHKILEKLNIINALKTGALFELSVSIPSIISNQDDFSYNLIRSYARNLGLLFQLSDDIVDVGQDKKAHQYRELNFVELFGVEKSLIKAEELAQITIAHLNELGPYKIDFLKGLVEMAHKRIE